jgi:ComF family protein
MVQSIGVLGRIDAIVPVPLHSTKLRRRGYNQAHLLAESIGDALDVRVIPMLVRHRETESQVALSREDRSANVAGAFSLDPAWSPAPGNRYLLVDDVRTTCATLNACARELLKTGPSGIVVMTLAFDVPNRELAQWLEERR